MVGTDEEVFKYTKLSVEAVMFPRYFPGLLFVKTLHCCVFWLWLSSPAAVSRVNSKLEAQVKQLEHENQARQRQVSHGTTQPSGAG